MAKYSAQKSKDGTAKTFIAVFEHHDIDVVLQWVKTNMERNTTIQLITLDPGQ